MGEQGRTAPFRFITREELMMMSEGFLSRICNVENPQVKSPKQIRASVISWWLKNYNLRQVQYMATHKYVSSTERYQLITWISCRNGWISIIPWQTKTFKVAICDLVSSFDIKYFFN